MEMDRFDGGSLMVWGGKMGDQKTDLVVMQDNLNARHYIDDVLRPDAIPFLHNSVLVSLTNMTMQDLLFRLDLIARQFLAHIKM